MSVKAKAKLLFGMLRKMARPNYGVGVRFRIYFSSWDAVCVRKDTSGKGESQITEFSLLLTKQSRKGSYIITYNKISDNYSKCYMIV